MDDAMKKKTPVKMIVSFLLMVMVVSNVYNILWTAKRIIAMQSVRFDPILIAYPAMVAYGLVFAKNKYLKRCILILLGAVISYDLACIIAKESMMLSTIFLSLAAILHIPVIILGYRFARQKEEIKNHGTD